MFSFGEQLYRLTVRDEETLLIEPFFRKLRADAVGAAVFGLGTFTVPPDRCLYVQRIMFYGQAYVAAVPYIGFIVELDTGLTNDRIPLVRRGSSAAGAGTPLISDGSNALVANSECRQSVEIDTVFPPGVRSIEFAFDTPAKAVTATAFLDVHAYLIPPGRIGRR